MSGSPRSSLGMGEEGAFLEEKKSGSMEPLRSSETEDPVRSIAFRSSTSTEPEVSGIAPVGGEKEGITMEDCCRLRGLFFYDPTCISEFVGPLSPLGPASPAIPLGAPRELDALGAFSAVEPVEPAEPVEPVEPVELWDPLVSMR